MTINIKGTSCAKCIDTLKEYLQYASTKYRPRSHGYQKAVEDTMDILKGKFSEIRARDLEREQEYKSKIAQRRNKK